MTDQQLINLIEMVELKSRAGSIAWEKTAESNSFQTTVAGYVLKSQEQFDPEYPDQPDYVLTIINQLNEIIESVSMGSIQELPPGFFPNVVLKNIYTSARRSAMGADEAISAITAALKNPQASR